jgi:hypothetical protein
MINVHEAPFVTRDHVAEKEAWARLARGRNRRAVTYRKWAIEAARDGNLAAYRKYSVMAGTSRKDALNALSFARLEAAYAP